MTFLRRLAEARFFQFWGRMLLPPLALVFYCLNSLLPAQERGGEQGEGWLLAAVLFYGLGHLLRALRLTVIAVPILKLPARLLFSLHFYTAPVSLALPFKLGELYRFQQLGGSGHDWARALLVVVLERALDAVVLSGVCLLLLMLGLRFQAELVIVAIVLAAAIIIAVLILVAAGPALAAMQGYIFHRHFSLRARMSLIVIDSIRRAIAVATHCLRGSFLILILLSLGVWACEWGTLASLTSHFNDQGLSVLIDEITMGLTGDHDRSLSQTPVYRYCLTAIIVMLLSWPIAASFYLRSALRDRAPSAMTTPRPLSLARLPRRVRFNLPRRVPWHTR